MLRTIAIILLLLFSLGWGIWVGEDLETFLGLSDVGMIGAVVLFVAGIVLPRGVVRRIGLALGVLVLSAVGYLIGNRQSGIAFNGCVRSGENVRQALADHRGRTGSFPVELGDLDQPLPGRRILRGSILDYRRTAEGYDLSFGDYSVTHSATESRTFEARK